MEERDPTITGRRELAEVIRERHRPDWLAVFFGLVVAFAIMGFMEMVAEGLRLARFIPSDSILAIVFRLFWLLVTVTLANYTGGFTTGLSMRARSSVAAALNGVLLSEFIIIVFFVTTYFGVSPLPGAMFSTNPGGEAREGLMWWSMMITLPNIFGSIFGTIHGNHFLDEEDPIDQEAKLEDEEFKEKAA